MHTAKCEICEAEVKFMTYRHDWPKGWTFRGKSRWGKKYHRRNGHAWYCPKCQGFSRWGMLWYELAPDEVRQSLLKHLPGLEHLANLTPWD